MKVYYGKNFYYKGEKKTPLRKIVIDRPFQWGNQAGVIFAIYVGDEGVAVDIGLETPREELEKFFTWYEQNWAGKEECLSARDHDEIENRNPLATSFRMKLSINRKELKSDFSCGVTYYNMELMKEFHAKSSEEAVEEQLIAEYGCDRSNGWYLSRHFAKWDKMPEKIETMEIVLKEAEGAKRTEQLEIGVDSTGEIFVIGHPVTGERYQMKVLEVTQEKMEWDEEPIPNMILPQHYLNVTYQMTPQMDARLFHFMAENGDEPRRKSISVSTGAVSIIGGASGPTSVFIAGKRKEPAVNSIPSGLFYEPITTAKFTPTFMVKNRDDLEITISLDKN